MPIIKVSSTELLKNQLLNPDWYKAKVVSFEISPSKDKQSINYTPTLEFPNGKQLPHNFNSKLLRMIEPFIYAVTGEIVDRTKDLEIDTDKLIGKWVKCKVINGTYNGNLQDQIEEWAPADKDTSPAF